MAVCSCHPRIMQGADFVSALFVYSFHGIIGAQDDDVVIRYCEDKIIGLTILYASQRQ